MNTNNRPKEINDYLSLVVERLKAADPYKIVLFGSYAKGNAKPDSDIDLMVILDSNYLPSSHREQVRYRSQVRDLIRCDEYKHGMDFKIYTRAEYKLLKDRDSFSCFCL
jgi:predicted nucleotidyltransferase